ncbi:MAG: S41 family peptidase [Paenibacillaceae bacterium]|nr:S41 family peptidase [Paenibacillaceae bacterium]
MVFRGRTVLAFVLLAVFATAVLTLTLVDPTMLARPSGNAAGPASSGSLSAKELAKLSTAYELIRTKYYTQIDKDKVLNGAINGMIGALDDPFSSYMDAKEAKQFDQSVTSSFEGIGAEVAQEDGNIKIVSAIKGTPSEKAGLHAGDVIVSVNDEKLDGLTLSQAVAKIRGPKGTQAKLGILRGGAAEPIEIIVVRDEIPVETVYAEMLDGKIGKLEIRQFSYSTADRVKEELGRLEAQGMKGLILDVRNDPGGILPVVVDIIQPFVAKGKPIVQIEDRQGNRKPTLSENPGDTKKYPVAVLINGGSASASEILAGAFKEAVPGSKLIGEKTYGKGTVQTTFAEEMGDGSNLKITIYKWLTPNGNWIHQKGIEPDLKVELPAYFKAAPFSRKATLKADMTGDDVRSLQLMLNGLGLPTDRTDGYFSEKTATAVKAFQRLQELPMTGEVDTATMDKLEKAIVAQIREPKNDTQLKAAVSYLQETIAKK